MSLGSTFDTSASMWGDAENNSRGNEMDALLDERCSDSVGSATSALPLNYSANGAPARRSQKFLG